MPHDRTIDVHRPLGGRDRPRGRGLAVARPCPPLVPSSAAGERVTDPTGVPSVAAEPVGVLAVDDDSIFLAGIARALRGVPCVASLFDAPEQALAHLDGGMPSLMLVDLHMPRMNGLEFLASVRLDFDTRATRLYLQSAGPPSRETEAEAARLDVGIVDKSVVLGRGWMRAAVHECRR